MEDALFVQTTRLEKLHYENSDYAGISRAKCPVSLMRTMLRYRSQVLQLQLTDLRELPHRTIAADESKQQNKLPPR